MVKPTLTLKQKLIGMLVGKKITAIDIKEEYAGAIALYLENDTRVVFSADGDELARVTVTVARYVEEIVG